MAATVSHLIMLAKIAMKVFFILSVSALLLTGCSSSKDTADKENMQVINATYEQWSEPPPAGSDVPERGTDLTIRIQNWPDGYVPQHIIYNSRKSLSASVTDSTVDSVEITGRIIRTSAVLRETSETIDLSDRLVFTDSGGDTSFVEISEWNSEE